MVKNPPAMKETQVNSLGQEDPLEKGMATHSSVLAWRIPQKEEPGRLQPMGSQRDTTEQQTLGFPRDSDSKGSAHNAGDPGLIPKLGEFLKNGKTTLSSILAWRIPWTEEPCRLQSLGLQRVGHG